MLRRLLSALVLLITVHCSLVAQPVSYVINGRVGKLSAPAQAFLIHEQHGRIVADSVAIIKGRFSFNATSLEASRVVYLILSKSGKQIDTTGVKQLKIYTDTSVISVVGSQSLLDVQVIAGSLNRDEAALRQALAPVEEKLAAANNEEEESDEKNAVYLAFIKSHPGSLISLYALQSLGGSIPDPEKVDPLFHSLSEEIRNLPAGKEYTRRLAEWKKITVGKIAPDFTLYDTSGRPVSLSSFRGKYVLLDFWASWCPPCRAENPNVKEAYKKYRNSNFTVLGVTLDNPDKKDAWLQAIHEDGLPWVQLASDTMWDNKAANLYSVKSIPQNFLIDPDGVIIAKNLRGDALNEKLSQVFLRAESSDTTSFTNPLLPSGPDPWILQKDGYYYYTHTTGNDIQLWKTKNIDQLSQATRSTIWKAVPGTPYSNEVWAPELHFLNNTWYVYFAASNGKNETHRLYVLENSSNYPMNAGGWTFRGKLVDKEDKWAIDASVFQYKKVNYIVWSGWEGDRDGEQKLYIAKLRNPWTIEGPRVMISKPVYDWETQITQGIHVKVNEGPEAIINNKGRLFLSFSAGGCWSENYCIGLMTLKDGGDPLNPKHWSKNPKPVFTKNTEGGAYGPGHNGFFTSPDGNENWIIYHANERSGQGCNNQRNPRMQQFTWAADGTPDFGTPVSIGAKIRKPAAEAEKLHYR